MRTFKRLLLAFGLVVVVAGLLAGTKILQFRTMMSAGASFVMPPETITAAPVQTDRWEQTLTAVGSLSAVQGTTLAAELAGKVTRIAFEPGSRVQAGALLLQQDVAAERAQLRAAEASVELARLTRDRLQTLLQRRMISQAEFDEASTSYREAQAQADAIRALIAKKTIRAPFSGDLGIRLVNLGQSLDAGQPIVSLQSLDPIYVDFRLPQQRLAQLQSGQTVRVTTDALPDATFTGTLTAISPEVDSSSRNLRLQATLANPEGQLRPGMFVNVAIVLPEQTPVLYVPATAVLYAPYGNSVFLVEESTDDQGAKGLKLRQQFVRLGEARGDFVALESGVKEGDQVASTGVFKLRNGQAVVIDNSLAPDAQLAPQPANQ